MCCVPIGREGATALAGGGTVALESTGVLGGMGILVVTGIPGGILVNMGISGAS